MPWKDTQSKTQRKKRNKLAFIVLLFVAGLIFLSWGIRFTESLFVSTVPRNYRWSGEFNINLVFRSLGISVLSYNPKEEKITILNIPDETFLQVPGSFGSWQIRAVYDLGQGRLLKNTLTSFLGVPVDGFLDLNAMRDQKSAAQFVALMRENPVSGFNLFSVLKTDLTIWELINLKRGLSAVRFDKIKELNPEKRGVLEKSTLPDGTQIYTADPTRIDAVVSDFADPAVLAEHKSIAVFNAADKPQLAQKWARLITNLGGNVIITANAEKKIKNTQVTGEQSQTLKRLQQIFDLDCQNNPKCDRISPSDEDLISSRAQINVFLGEDFDDL